MKGPAADLSAYLDGELPWRRRLAIWWHLRRCEPCRRVVAQLAEVRAAARRASA